MTQKTILKYFKEITSNDKNVKLIFNRTDYGHIKSPFHAIRQTNSDATIF